MAATTVTYPALYEAASDASAEAQRNYLWLLRIEYGLLLVAACFTAVPITDPNYLILYALVFFAALVVLLTRSFLKPEQTWYKSRALAESIKTTTWRYMMRADPYLDNENLQVPRSELRNHLRQILSANDFPKSTFIKHSEKDQITPEMAAVRALNLNDRMEFYSKNRIAAQRKWYAMKAGKNKKAFVIWMAFCALIYVVAGVSVLVRIRHPEWTYNAAEPLIVLAASVVAWIQIKKFNELAASYSLTAHEIGLVAGQLTEINGESAFSDFVRDAELAFSREHTQWVARQTS